MFRVCILEFGGPEEQFLSLMEFMYNNSCPSSSLMALLEALRGKHYHTLVSWFETTMPALHRTDLVLEELAIVQLI